MDRGQKLMKGALLGLGLPLALAACGGQQTAATANTAPCPRIAILADGADLTRHRPGMQRDLTGLVLDARIQGFEARCDFAGSDRTGLTVRITPRFEAERGPAAEGRTVDLPWFVVLTDAEDREVLARVAATTRLGFAPNVPRAQAVGQMVQLDMPIGGGRRAADYTVRVSFQLTPEELALNRQRGPR
jgi:hypothetical protein